MDLQATGQGPKALKTSTWQHSSRVLAPRIRPLEENLGQVRIETQTLAEGLNSSSLKHSKNHQFNIFKFFYNSKTWLLGVVWSSTKFGIWAVCETPLIWSASAAINWWTGNRYANGLLQWRYNIVLYIRCQKTFNNEIKSLTLRN